MTEGAKLVRAVGLVLICGLMKAQVATNTTLISVTPSAPQFGEVVTLTAQVAPAAAPGAVSFMDGGILVGVGTLNFSGIAQLKTIALPAGTHSLRAVYGGGTGYQTSQSATVPYVVTAAPGVGFGAALNYGAGCGPISVAVGDFNSDGKADLAVGNNCGYTLGAVNVFLGKGDGTAQSALTYGAGTGGHYSVAVMDFNGDGRADLAVATFDSNSISVLLGNGNGTFQPATDYEAGGGPICVAAGDFNGDGTADLAVANYYGDVSVLLGNGDGTFQSPTNYGVSNPRSVAVGDFNGDGKPDLAAASTGGNKVSVLLGNGDANGTFQSAVDYGTGSSPMSVAVGDFNGDGKPDLAVANYGGGVSVLLGNGDGTFPAPVTFNAGTGPTFVAVGDFNGDGKHDLAVANYGGGVSVLVGNGDGTFQAPVTYGAGAGPVSVAVADFNGDARADLAVASFYSSYVGMLLGIIPPTLGGVSPNTGTGAVQTFTGAYSAEGSYHELVWVEMLFAAAPNGGGQSFCFVHYDVWGNAFWLYGDHGFFLGPITPGASSNLLQNSSCALNTGASSVTGSGPTLTVNAAVVFKTAGARTIYLRAVDKDRLDTGWVQRGTWTMSAAALETMTVIPSSGSVTHGTQQTFTLTYPDTPGFVGAAFGWDQLLIAAASDGGGQPFCFVHYDRAGNGLWMYSGDVGFFVGPVAPGAASSALDSSACSVNTASATVQNTGGNLVLSVPVTMKAPMTGAKKVFERSLTVLSIDTGWVQTGTFTVN